MKAELKDLLIVEDNAYIGNSILNSVKEIDSVRNIHLTDSIQEAISLTNKLNFNLIVLDLSLPDGNGLELLKLFREKEKKKILVFSTSTNLKQVCLKYGAYDFFDKANDFDKLIETIKVIN
ncbi:response regulator [Polaribacter sargassicola]|uniref:response regulator n=1 Tax=Polaribacter sargassicola TaxID=2836891 RepID=UPI001F1C1581|nr:response regulator [Polaribacter sp. DS7-9]MCG1037736.1 response regulator [Polaribacter sp. DS7-9]